ncbi:hypothetical protein CALVIDRAFT_390574 [Calocera viscosa TUFC12733]|uniref:Uncharacterized protein n=1 Tax=Calocera viscosa (strain TUFC12733) TaxID=1330018 RepID=A0A167GJ08_CALVF|nr:hypothetical protein CALVIDRAFT_390574 [Calocera viscosa TUFC12733]
MRGEGVPMRWCGLRMCAEYDALMRGESIRSAQRETGGRAGRRVPGWAYGVIGSHHDGVRAAECGNPRVFICQGSGQEAGACTSTQAHARHGVRFVQDRVGWFALGDKGCSSAFRSPAALQQPLDLVRSPLPRGELAILPWLPSQERAVCGEDWNVACHKAGRGLVRMQIEKGDVM